MLLGVTRSDFRRDGEPVAGANAGDRRAGGLGRGVCGILVQPAGVGEADRGEGIRAMNSATLPVLPPLALIRLSRRRS